jgi:WD40 repeat protein
LDINELAIAAYTNVILFTSSFSIFSNLRRLTVGTMHSRIPQFIPVLSTLGKLLTTFKNQQRGKVTSISLSADGSLLATLREDSTAKLWRIGDFDELLEQGCDQVRDYLATLDENNSDRHLCDDIIVNSHP